MKPAPFDYVRPGSLDDAIAALAGDPGAKVLAGGQSLVPLLSMRLAAPSRLVDINGLPGPRRDRGRARRRAHRRARAARRRTGVGGRTPGAAAGQPGPGQRRPRDHPQPRHDRRLDRARRRGRRDADGAAAAGRLGRGGRAVGAAHDRRRRPLRRPAGVVAAPRRDRGVGVLPRPADGCRRGLRGDRPTPRRLRAVRRRCAGHRRQRARPATCRSARCPTVVDLTGVADADLGDAALEHLDPGDDIHASADYRAQLVRVLTARVVAAARKMAQGGSAQ